MLLRKILLFSFVFALFISCEKENPFPVDVQANDFVWKGLNAYYLYQDQVNDLSDRRFSNEPQLLNYLSSFETPEDIFNALRIGTDTRTQLLNDHTTADMEPAPRSAFTTGLEFAVTRDPSRMDSVIVYALDVLPMSFASTQMVSRGDFFYAVVDENNDTIRLAEDNYEDLLLNYPQDTLKLLKTDYDGMQLTITDEQVNLVRQNYQHNPIHFSRVIDLAPTQVGYLMYQNDFSRNYIQDLNTAMLNFRNAGVTELVLDLRYNIGGGSFASTVAELASIITRQFENQVLMKETWNSKAQPWFELNQPDSLLTRFPTQLQNGTAINSLNLTDVYIVLNGNRFNGSSTLELLINSLQAYVTVHIIGNTTTGDNLGSITLYDSPDYDPFQINENHTYGLQPAVLTFSNFNDEPYDSGISPTIALCPIEDPLELGELGETTDPILDRILNYITTGDMGMNPPCNPLEFEILYHSINAQRIPDTGIFIKQDLPNLGR
jgi:C-terminal processing protease CtpA/Prc